MSGRCWPVPPPTPTSTTPNPRRYTAAGDGDLVVAIDCTVPEAHRWNLHATEVDDAMRDELRDRVITLTQTLHAGAGRTPHDHRPGSADRHRRVIATAVEAVIAGAAECPYRGARPSARPCNRGYDPSGKLAIGSDRFTKQPSLTRVRPDTGDEARGTGVSDRLSSQQPAAQVPATTPNAAAPAANRRPARRTRQQLVEVPATGFQPDPDLCQSQLRRPLGVWRSCGRPGFGGLVPMWPRWRR